MVDIYKLLVESEEKRAYVKRIEIREVLPCFTTPGYIRFIAQADRELSELIPIVFLRTPPGRASYSIEENILTLRMYNRLITLFPSGKIAVTNTRDIREAKEITEKIRRMLNEAYLEYRRRGKPTRRELEAKAKLTWMDIYHTLPKLDCGDCGYQTCSAFAVAVYQGEAKLANCPHLKGNLKLSGVPLSSLGL
ncbi:MAG: hypothetical protein DRN96_03895 [Thermoproteota archaeon]|nr:MAG: hypothetical protein DRN96_03895 [Candidatus Korarchaeota archaeon]